MNEASGDLEKMSAPAVHVDAERLQSVLKTVGFDSFWRLLTECRRRLETMTADLARADVADHRREALANIHKFRGSCSSLGLLALCEALRRIESDIVSAADADFTARCFAEAPILNRLIETTWAHLAQDAQR
jgi:HPt (histidine-containing phosphotransfer) domain-containing protein